MNNIFESAVRNKLRFASGKGSVTTEDLWDLSLDNLDTLAKTLNKEVEASSETSYIKKRSTAGTESKLKFDVVLHVINTKLAEADARKLIADKKAKNAQILELINAKENEALGSKSLEELKALLVEEEA